MQESAQDLACPEPAIGQEAPVRAAGVLFQSGPVQQIAITDADARPVGVLTRNDFIRMATEGGLERPVGAHLPEHAWMVLQSETSLAHLLLAPADFMILVDERGVFRSLSSKREMANRYMLQLDDPLLLAGYGCLLAIQPADGSEAYLDGGPDTVPAEAARAFLPASPLRQAVLETARGGRVLSGRELEWNGASWMAFTVPIQAGETRLGAIGLFHHAREVRAVIGRLKRVEHLYDEVNTILETSYDGFTIIDGQGFITRVNKAHARITGSRPENMIGRHILDCEKDGELTNPVSVLVLRDKRRITIKQHVKNGKFVTVTGNPVFDAEGNIKMVVCNVRDTTEIEAMQERMLKTEMAYQVELEHLRKQQLGSERMIVTSPAMRQVMETVEHVADKETSVLILGETGVGKEVLAKRIHQISKRRDGTYLKINCCAMPPSLLESELFGYENGAFTGARKGGKPGLLEAARGGTIFLDEIGDISMELQVKLLRVLQEKEIMRVGGLKAIAVDSRFIFATNRDLKAMVTEGRFRKDLYYRLNVVPISIPALRHRKEDIRPFLEFFLEKFNQKHGYDKTFAPELVQVLCGYGWPGNVRELENLVERLVVSVYGSTIGLADIAELGTARLPQQDGVERGLPLRQAVEALEKELISQALLSHGSMGRVAEALGVDRTTILRKIAKYRIPYAYQW